MILPALDNHLEVVMSSLLEILRECRNPGGQFLSAFVIIQIEARVIPVVRLCNYDLLS